VPATRRTLVLTAAARARGGAGAGARLLGPWCHTAEELLSGETPAESSHYHWDDRAKFARDYDYLQSLHARVLAALVPVLNRRHDCAHPTRYWQILLDPWLMSWLSVCFDRWESVRIVFDGGESFASIDTAAAAAAPHHSYMEFIDAVLGDAWNEWLMARMIEFQHGDRCRVEPRAAVSSPTAGREVPRLAKRFATAFDRALAPLSRRNRVAFVQSYFRPASLLRLSLALGQVPRTHLADFPADEPGPAATHPRAPADAERLRAQIQPQNDFERFIAARLPQDLPAVVVEEFARLARYARSLGQEPDVIVTATAQFSNPVAKAWFAERVAAGSSLVVLEHGGSFPAARELFEFEEDISDVRVPWFMPYHPKHRQLPPSKLVGAPQRRVNADGPCFIVANESPPWTVRAHFYPMAHQCLRSYRMVCDMVEALSADVSRHVSIRPAPNQGWNLAALFTKKFGEGRVSRRGTLEDALAQARLIVCTYPETTFSEAMASGLPVVLVYPPEIYERHPVAFPLLEQLRRARIVFHDAAAAAEHVSAVWSDPGAWWSSPDVVAARRAFRDAALRFDGDWIREWTGFLRSFPQPDNREKNPR
jgi:putative transferase (TIGR04331 family)